MKYEMLGPQEVASRIAEGSDVILGLDLETTGLSPRDHKVRLVQVSTGSGAFLIDVFEHPDLSPLKDVFEEETITKVLHNAKFDVSFLMHRHGIKTAGIFDTMIAAQLLGVPGGASLKNVVSEYLFLEMKKEEQASDWSRETLTESQLEYAARDAELLVPLWAELYGALEKKDLVGVAELEFACVPAVASMELAGLGINLEAMNEMRKVEVERREAAAIEFERQLPYQEEQQGAFDLDLPERSTINLGSPKQVKEAFLLVGIEIPNTQAKEIQKIKHPLAKPLLEFRKHAKRLSGFLEPFPGHVRKDTGRIHANFRQTKVVTGRFACSDPNLQNIPKAQEFRSLFVADEGNMLITADYSQIELRILAELSGDEELLRIFNAGEDLHAATYSVMYGKPLEEVTKEERGRGKNINFGLVYGQGPGTLADTLGVTEEQARALMKSYFEGFPKVREWTTQQQKMGDYKGHVRTLSGRWVNLTPYSDAAKENTKDGKWKRRRERGDRYREASNYPIQGTSADITKRALTLIYERFRNSNEVWLVNCVHDEIVVECVEEAAGMVEEIVKAKMIEAGEQFLKKVPVEVDAEVAKEWKK